MAALALGTAGGWLAADRLQSPEQIEAAAQAPTPGPVTAAVVAGDLAETITAQAQVGRTTSQESDIPLPDADVAVVTAAPVDLGVSVVAGSLVRSVNDRPVFALPGAFPLYRNIGRGDTGADVRQLQDGLRAAGYQIRDRELGTFGADTAQAVRDLYKTTNYAVASEVVEAATTGTLPSSAAAGDPPPPTPATRLVVPRTEVTVVPSLPAVLTSAPAVGIVLTADNAVLQFESGALSARAPVAVGVVGRVAVGTAATLQDSAGVTVAATVTAVVPAAADGTQAQLVLDPSSDPLPDAWAGTTVLATISIQAVAEQALIVPTAAIATSGSGPPRVLKELPDGSFVTVEVTELGTLGGRSAVAPLNAADLVEGDEIRVD